jgi:hypothetical protein
MHYPPRLVAGEQIFRRPPAGLFFEYTYAERLAAAMPHDEADVGFSSTVLGGLKRRPGIQAL